MGQVVANLSIKRLAIYSSSKSVSGGIFFAISSEIFKPLERVVEVRYSISVLEVGQ